MAVETQAGLPASFFAGDTVRFTVSLSGYPSTSWALAVIFGANALKVDATASGNGFLVELSGANTENLLGAYAVTFTLTSGGERITEPAGTLTVHPNPAATPALSFAQSALVVVEAALLKLSAGTNQIVDINGQQFTKKDINKLMDYRDKLRAEVASENTAPGSGGRGRLIATRFI